MGSSWFCTLIDEEQNSSSHARLASSPHHPTGVRTQTKNPFFHRNTAIFAMNSTTVPFRILSQRASVPFEWYSMGIIRNGTGVLNNESGEEKFYLGVQMAVEWWENLSREARYRNLLSIRV